jgi:hypothetical protein
MSSTAIGKLDLVGFFIRCIWLRPVIESIDLISPVNRPANDLDRASDLHVSGQRAPSHHGGFQCGEISLATDTIVHRRRPRSVAIEFDIVVGHRALSFRLFVSSGLGRDAGPDA